MEKEKNSVKPPNGIFSILMSSSITGLWRGLIGLPF